MSDKHLKHERQEQPIHICHARPEDAEQIVSIQAETWLATYPNEEYGITREDILAKDMGNPSRIERWKRDIEYAATRGDRQVFAAKRGSEVLGYCFVFRKPSGEGYIGALYLRPSEHGKGIGRQLMDTSLAWLGEECAVSLGVAIYNKAAIALYKKLGFEMRDEQPDPIPPLPSGAQMPIVKMVRPAKKQEIESAHPNGGGALRLWTRAPLRRASARQGVLGRRRTVASGVSTVTRPPSVETVPASGRSHERGSSGSTETPERERSGTTNSSGLTAVRPQPPRCDKISPCITTIRW